MYAGGGSEWQVIPCRSEGGVCWETGPSGWEPDEPEEETGLDGSERNPAGSGVNQKQGHISKYVPLHLLRLDTEKSLLEKTVVSCYLKSRCTNRDSACEREI